MKSSIKMLAIMVLVFTFSFAANAQRGDRSMDPEKMAEKETTQMVEKLSLDESQTAKVKELNLTYAKKMQEAQEDNDGDRNAMKEIKTAIDKEKAAEMKLVLTDTQFKAYEKMQTKGGKGKGRKGGRQSK